MEPISKDLAKQLAVQLAIQLDLHFGTEDAETIQEPLHLLREFTRHVHIAPGVVRHVLRRFC